MLTAPPPQPVGELLRSWRQRRRLSQLDLANEAEVSTRHVSFLENGRARPSREMLLHLAARLDIPLREQNTLLLAAGYAPVYQEHSLDDAAMRAARAAVHLVLNGHEPNPALAVDRHWTMVAANRSLTPLLTGANDDLLRPPVNVLRLSLHPDGLAPRIANLPQWREHVFERLRRQIDASADPVLIDLLAELRAYPDDNDQPAPPRRPAKDDAGVVVPIRLRTEHGLLSFLTTTTIFGTPIDVTLSELAIESFFPADPATADDHPHPRVLLALPLVTRANKLPLPPAAAGKGAGGLGGRLPPSTTRSSIGPRRNQPDIRLQLIQMSAKPLLRHPRRRICHEHHRGRSRADPGRRRRTGDDRAEHPIRVRDVHVARLDAHLLATRSDEDNWFTSTPTSRRSGSAI